jgi:adenine phosphoribosyltransferase
MDEAALRALVRDIPDFPTPGVIFKDLTPLFAEPGALAAVVNGMSEPFVGESIDRVVGIEARGFICAAPVAERLAAGFVPVRKPGKLPWTTAALSYDLEYGTDTLEIHRDAIAPGQRVLIVDDVLATGGTAAATIGLVEELGGEVVGLSFLIELGFLAGRERIPDRWTRSLLRY